MQVPYPVKCHANRRSLIGLATLCDGIYNIKMDVVANCAAALNDGVQQSDSMMRYTTYLRHPWFFHTLLPLCLCLTEYLPGLTFHSLFCLRLYSYKLSAAAKHQRSLNLKDPCDECAKWRVSNLTLLMCAGCRGQSLSQTRPR